APDADHRLRLLDGSDGLPRQKRPRGPRQKRERRRSHRLHATLHVYLLAPLSATGSQGGGGETRTAASTSRVIESIAAPIRATGARIRRAWTSSPPSGTGNGSPYPT